MTVRIHSFPPIESSRARVLILGTMPGKASLAAQQYYAHPRNAFWHILGSLLGFDPAAPYALRTRSLSAAAIAVWDVLHSCERTSSLDSDIAEEIPNDFATFFAAHSRITTVFFNGGNAARLYARHVRPLLGGLPPLEEVRLPSTSPAHAGLRLDAKLRAWGVVVEKLRAP